MENVLLMSANKVRTLTSISDNISDKYLFAAINESQEVVLRSLLGDNLLDTLKSLVKSGDIEKGENAKYKDLIERCSFMLAYTAVSKLCVILSYKMDNTGVYKTRDENVDAASIDEVKNMQQYYEDQAGNFRLQIVNYLLKNQSDYPELLDNDVNAISSNLYSAENCGIVLGGARGKGRLRNVKSYVGK